MNTKKYAAEAIGTFWLTFAGCGSAVIAAGFPQVGIGLVGVSLAFGLSVVTMAYAIGHISGCHLNPAVTVGLAAGGRFPTGQILPYIIAQVIGAIVAAALLYVIASGAPGFDVSKGFASNGFDAHSPGQYGMVACFITEVVMTMMFLFIIMGATHGRAPAGFAPLAIGLALVMIHLVSIPVTNTSVNPARSTGPALFVGGWALSQLWMFWVAPLIGGALGGVYLRSAEEAARSLRIQFIVAAANDAAEIDRVFASLASEPDGAVIVMASGLGRFFGTQGRWHRAPQYLLGTVFAGLALRLAFDSKR